MNTTTKGAPDGDPWLGHLKIYLHSIFFVDVIYHLP